MTLNDIVVDDVAWAADSTRGLATQLGALAGTMEALPAQLHAGPGPDVWQGEGAAAFDSHVGGLVARLDRFASAYAEAGRLLAAYVLDLEGVRARARQADAALSEAMVLSLRWQQEAPVSSNSLPMEYGGLYREPDWGLELRAHGERLVGQAWAEHDDASRRLAAGLRALAAQAPSPGWSSGAVRGLHDTGGAIADTVTGIGGLGMSAWRAIPGVGDDSSRGQAREVLLDGALGSLQFWEPFEQAWDDGRGGRSGLALGGIIGGFGGKGWAPKNRNGNDDEGFYLEKDVERARELAERTDRLRLIPPPTLDVLLRDGIDLDHHEALGGHTLDTHVGKDESYMRERLLFEQGKNPPGTRATSTFTDRPTAQACIDQVLRANHQRLEAWLQASVDDRLAIELPFDHVVGQVLAKGTLQPSQRARVVLHRENGRLRLMTAYAV